MVDYYTPTIELRRKDGGSLTSTDTTDSYSLVKFRMSGQYSDTLNGTAKNGQITLRNPDDKFTSESTHATDADLGKYDLVNIDTKNDYVVFVKIEQERAGVTVKGKEFLFEITEGREHKGKGGRFVTLTLTALDVRLGEFLNSDNLRLIPPKEAFIKRLEAFNSDELELNAGTNNASIDLIDDERFRQDWLVSSPKSIRDLLTDVVERLSRAESDSTTNEDWYYDISYDDANDRYKISAGKLGALPTSPITIKTSDVVQHKLVKETDRVIDNARFKNVIIAEGKKGVHSLPMDFTRIASDLLHAGLAAEYVGTAQYEKGDYVKHNDGRRYKARVSTIGHTPQSNNTNSYWLNLDPVNITTSGNDLANLFPWYEASEWIDRLSGQTVGGFQGFFHDMNIARREFQTSEEIITGTSDIGNTISVKDVKDELSAPPSDPQHIDRYVLGSSPTGGWSSASENDIAQWNAVTESWDITTPNIDDLIHVLDTVEIYKYGRNSGDPASHLADTWNRIWYIGDTSTTSEKPNVERPNPFIPVTSITNISDERGIRGKALRFTYDWNVFRDPDDVINVILSAANYIFPVVAALGIAFEWISNNLPYAIEQISDAIAGLFGGTNTFTDDAAATTAISDDFTLDANNLKNRAGRRYGWSLRLPWDDSKGYMDFENLDGKWHDGVDSEDLGNIRGVQFWTRLTHKDAKDRTLSDIANTPMVYWFRDMSDRVVYTEYTIRYHGAWQKITVPAGPDASLQQHDSRIDELASIFGYTLPFDYFIRERELTGATFDWHHVVETGSFGKQSYSDRFLYIGGQDAFFNIFTEYITQQTVKSPLKTLVGLDFESVITDKVHLDLDNLHFVKDSYVSSLSDIDTVPSDPRAAVLSVANQDDYINMKAMAKRYQLRQQFHPEYHIISCHGNPAIKAGERFYFEDSTNELVAMSVKHMEDPTGYHCTIQAARRFTA